MSLYLDFARCADWNETCPPECWRAKLTKATAEGKAPADAVFTFVHFEGGPGCIKKGGESK